MNKSKIKSTQAGLTLVESMVAMIIFSGIIVMMTPPIIMSMATRVRTRQAQQALQVAQSEIDRVRSIVDRGPTTTSVQSDIDNYKKQLPPDAGIGTAQSVGAPTASLGNCDATIVREKLKTCSVTLNSNGNLGNFEVQTFMIVPTEPVTKGTSIPGIEYAVGFNMGVRVYTKKAIENGGLETQPASLRFSAGTTDSKRPLAVIYTSIVKSDLEQSQKFYCKLTGGTGCGYN